MCIDGSELIDFQAADPQFGDRVPSLKRAFKSCDSSGILNCNPTSTVRQWLNQTTAMVVYKTERRNYDQKLEDFVQTSTVIQNLKFDTDRATRYFNDIKIHSCAYD